MVLCYSRMMYVEFFVSQTMEHFLAAHQNAFAVLGCPTRIIVDNLRSAVLRHLVGEAPVFNERYLDFTRHHGLQITACNLYAGHEKGRVERGVGYVKANLLNGLELSTLAALNTQAQLWLQTVANVRVHGATHRRPVDLFAAERGALRPPNALPYDTSPSHQRARLAPVPRRAGDQHVLGAGAVRRLSRDAQGLPRPRVRLSRPATHRAAHTLLRPASGHRGS
jgi:hypothetical protein